MGLLDGVEVGADQHAGFFRQVGVSAMRKVSSAESRRSDAPMMAGVSPVMRARRSSLQAGSGGWAP